MRCVVLALALMLVTGASHAAELDVGQLMQGLAQTRSGHAAFTEKKFIAMLDKPVESSGELFYSAPDRLEKRTIKPKPESMILDSGTLVIERGRQKHTLQLQDYPELAAVIDSIRGTLAGDRKALTAFMAVEAWRKRGGFYVGQGDAPLTTYTTASGLMATSQVSK